MHLQTLTLLVSFLDILIPHFNSFDDSVESYHFIIFFIFRLVGVFRMVLQKLIQDGHLEVRESLIDMNNTVLKVRLESRKKMGSTIISSTGFRYRHAMYTEHQRFDPNYQKILQFFQGSLTS